jgi:hypothetical protein
LKSEQLAFEQREMETVYLMNAEPEVMLSRLEEEVNAKQHLTEEILVNEIDSLSEYITDLEQLDSNSQNGGEYLNGLNYKIDTLTEQINQEMSRKMLEEEPKDDQYALFKQNVSCAIIIII